MDRDGTGTEIRVLPTHIGALDDLLAGGLPVYSCSIVAGRPGAGKTVLAQQILFNHIRHDSGARVLYLTTLSEPRTKVVRFVQQFAFFNPDAFGEKVVYQDVGRLLRGGGLADKSELLMRVVAQHRPNLLVVDSFSAIRDVANTASEFRLFCYDLAEQLAGARCTALLVGEYDRPDLATGPEFAVADGIFYLELVDRAGEQQRFFQVLKLRGQAADLRPCPFVITSRGAHLFSPAGTSDEGAGGAPGRKERVFTGIDGLDALTSGGIPAGHTVILSGVSGAGKTIASTQFLVHGAAHGERVLLVTFEEAPDQLRRMAQAFGWDLAALEARGLLRIVFVPQNAIRLMDHLAEVSSAVEEFRPRRIVIDSFSVFLHRVTDPATQREMTYRLTAVVRRVGAVGVLVSDITNVESSAVSRFGVEETVADGTIVLSSARGPFGRRRYLEVYKMRDCAHVTGRQRMLITGKGIEVLFDRGERPAENGAPRPSRFAPLEGIVKGELTHGMAWLVRGDAGAGKSALAYQFAVEGLRQGEHVLFVAADSPAYHVCQALRRLGGPPECSRTGGPVRVIDLTGWEQGEMDARDPEVLVFRLKQQVAGMRRPVRLVIDSLWPMASNLEAHDFVDLVQRKNLMLRAPDVSVFDTIPSRTLDPMNAARLLNAYDTVLEALQPEGNGEAAPGSRTLRLLKVRGVEADLRPFPYTLSRGAGVVVEKGFYDG